MGSDQHLRRVEAATPLPTRFAQPGCAAPFAATGRDRVCMHWPLEGTARIHAGSRALAALAQRWDEATHARGAWPPMPPHCIDVHTPVAIADHTRRRWLAHELASEIEDVRQQLRAIANEFQTAAHWLCRGAGSASNRVVPTRHSPGLASALGEDHRVATRDRLAADMNALVAWLLRQAVKVLEEIDPQTAMAQGDLADAESYGEVLLTSASMLARASALAQESELFIEALDLRWHALRDHITATVASSKALSAETHAYPAAPGRQYG